MSKKYRGLGKGLNELLSSTLGAQANSNYLPSVPVEPEGDVMEVSASMVPGQT